jgi:hypothetical protein
MLIRVLFVKLYLLFPSFNAREVDQSTARLNQFVVVVIVGVVEVTTWAYGLQLFGEIYVLGQSLLDAL